MDVVEPLIRVVAFSLAAFVSLVAARHIYRKSS